jgi:subtilisin family serine protease
VGIVSGAVSIAGAGDPAPEPRIASARLAPALVRLNPSAAARFSGGVPVILGLEPGADLWSAASRLADRGAGVVWFDVAENLHQIGLRVPGERLADVLDEIAGLDRLAWADLQPPIRLRNGVSAWRCQSGVPDLTPIFDRGLRGEGQVIGVMDTGLDVDHCLFDDPAYGLPALNGDSGTEVSPEHRKVLAVDFYWQNDWPDPGIGDWDDNGHGTHVAGSAAGYGGGDGGVTYDGMAPAARLVVQDGGSAVDDCADLPGLGCPLRPLGPVLEQAYLQGARIHTNSWGDEENIRPFNRYTERTADIDRFVWNHRDFVVFFAAGNAGPAADSVGSPSTGKNLVAVGATLRGNDQPPCIAGFSSRGWTHDGRIKPDVVVPGASIVSAHSDRTIDTGNCSPDILSGTSMATPTAAGLAALVRQYFTDGYYPLGQSDTGSGFEPSAALVKAMLIASAVDLTTLGCDGIDPVPSRDQGWGIVQLDRALLFQGDREDLLVEDRGLEFDDASDDPFRRTVLLPDTTDLKVVLVWTDPPSDSLAELNLVNDLDLEVVGAGGGFRGNRFSGGVSVPGGEPDRLNNVEVVWIPDADPGWWTIEVAPHRIVETGQDFALVVVGDVEARPQRLRRGGPRSR